MRGPLRFEKFGSDNFIGKFRLHLHRPAWTRACESGARGSHCRATPTCLPVSPKSEEIGNIPGATELICGYRSEKWRSDSALVFFCHSLSTDIRDDYAHRHMSSHCLGVRRPGRPTLPSIVAMGGKRGSAERRFALNRVSCVGALQPTRVFRLDKGCQYQVTRLSFRHAALAGLALHMALCFGGV